MADEIVIRKPNLNNLGEADQMKDAFISTSFFYDFEIEVVSNMIDESETYQDIRTLVAVDNDRVVGVGMYGRDSMSKRAWMLYWIGVHQDYRNKGVGKILLNAMENGMAEDGGGICCLETASRELYTPTRRFYLNNGYYWAATLKDYYADGDSKCIFTKEIKCAAPNV